MSSVRTLLPIDLPALLACSGLSTSNAAYPRERLGGDGQPALEVLRDQLSAFTRRRNAWVRMRRQRLEGLVGARRRRSNAAWEIDYLLDATDGRTATSGLLEHAIGQVGRRGAQKLFLRLEAGSDLLQAARESGFMPFREETLYVREAADIDHAPATVRPLLPVDAYPLFRLYCAAVPETARRSEAATFDEWQAMQERKDDHSLVLERAGGITARVQASALPHGTLVDLLLDPSAAEQLPGLVAAVLAAAGPSERPVFSLLPQTAGGLAKAFEAEGFAPYTRYVSLMRRTTKPLALPREVPVVAENAVGV